MNDNIKNKRLIGILEIFTEHEDSPSFSISLDEMKGIVFNDDGTYSVGNFANISKITELETHDFEYLGVIKKEQLTMIKTEMVAPNEEYEPDAYIYTTVDEKSIKFVNDNSLPKNKPESFQYVNDATDDEKVYSYKK